MPRQTEVRLSLTSWVSAAALCAGLAVSPAFAQPPPPVSMTQDLPSADFLFGRPRATLGLRGALAMPTAGSDLFDFIRDELTIGRRAFNGPAFAFEVGLPVTSRVDVVVGADLARGKVLSEYRDFVDNNELPIQQESVLKQNGLNASIRLLLTPRGHAVGRFAWVPSRLTPYVGAGGGLLWWDFRQTGDFVDFQNFEVFPETFQSGGTTPTAHVLGGFDVQMYKRLLLSIEGRYQWASDTLGVDFIDFEPIDLSGFRLAAGINLIF